MNQRDVEYKKMAKAHEDYKAFERAASFYWGALIVMPLILLGASQDSFLVIMALFILSIPMFFRKVLYFIVSLSPFPFFFLSMGWIGLLVAVIPALISAFSCFANYQFSIERKDLETND